MCLIPGKVLSWSSKALIVYWRFLMKILKLRLLAALVLTSTVGILAGGNSHASESDIDTKELNCLAKNIYYEARGESIKGKIAVAQVTLNRVKSAGYRDTICKVVYQPFQFSWTRDKTRKAPRGVAWAQSLDLAKGILTETIQLPHFPALYFHNKTVKPHWTRKKRVLARIGGHVFYI
jgi:spore germination cell wall hydrolase CwlJ-like protein